MTAAETHMKMTEGDVSEKVATVKGIDGEPYHILWSTSGLPLGLGLVAYTISGHAIVPSIYSSMDRPQDFERMIDFSFLDVIASCLVVAVGDITCLRRLSKTKLQFLWRKQVPRLSYGYYVPHVAHNIDGILQIHPRHVPIRLLGIEEIFARYVSDEATAEVESSAAKLILIILWLAVAILFRPLVSYAR